MKDCTYYDMLGVPLDATDEQIINAKNFLVKKFHPDSNVGGAFDTTLYMQNVLDAYHILSDPMSRRVYDRRIRNPRRREHGFEQTAYSAETGPLSPNFAPFWESANKLNTLVSTGSALLKQKRFSRVLELSDETSQELARLASEADIHIQVLESGGIPREYWFSHAMNWLLFQWSQHRNFSYLMLFSMYDSYLEQNKSAIERRKILSQCSTFLGNLDKLINYRQVS